MKPKFLISIGRWGKIMLDFYIMRQAICQTNEIFNFMNCRQVERQSSCMDLSLLYQKKDPSVALRTPSMALKIHEHGE